MSTLDLKIDEFKVLYDSKMEYYTSALTYFTELINTLSSVEYTSGRIKRYETCVSKFERKYLPKIEPGNTKYQIYKYLTDLIGIRVVCFYIEDVKNIQKELKKYFREVDITDKTGRLEQTDDKFGYKGLHLDLRLKQDSKSVDYKNYGSVQFELQIRTVIQDAWSILDHKIKYKKSIPRSLKRRINRLSALFEIADDEFLRIKEEIINEEKRISGRIKRGDAVEKDVSLDVFRFLFVALKHFPEINFSEFKVDGFVQEILEINPGFSEGDLNDVLLKYLNKVDLISKTDNKQLSPYTKIRYCLYLSDQVKFSKVLTAFQKEAIQNNKVSINS
jgi:putative GTP pyrophosphokinase